MYCYGESRGQNVDVFLTQLVRVVLMQKEQDEMKERRGNRPGIYHQTGGPHGQHCRPGLHPDQRGRSPDRTQVLTPDTREPHDTMRVDVRLQDKQPFEQIDSRSPPMARAGEAG